MQRSTVVVATGLRLSFALLASTMAGCFSGEIPNEALITCESEEDCPSGFSCAAEVARCIPDEVLAAPGPELDGEAAITPALARAGVTVRVSFRADQTLGERPHVTIEGSDFAFALVEDESDEEAAEYVYAAPITAAAPSEGTHTVVAAVKSTVGRPGVLRLGTFVVDSTPNRVDGVLSIGGALGVGASATLSFRVLEAVDEAHEPRVFFASADGLESEAWERISGDGSDFSFRYTVPDPSSLAEGLHEVHVVLEDNAGNESAPLRAGAVEIDTTAPSLVESALDIEPDPDGGAWHLSGPPVAAGGAALVTLSFTSDEALGDEPLVEVTCPGAAAIALERAQNESSNRFFRYLLDVVDDVTPEGTCAASALLVDPAGNVSQAALPDIVIDHTPPVALVDGAGAGARLLRAPWGAADLDGDGVADRGARVVVDEPDEPSLVLVAFEPSSGGVLGRGVVSQPLDLGALDRRDVHIAAVDAAGNISARAAVRQGEWVATLGDKVADSLIENPHRAIAYRALPSSLEDGSGLELANEVAGEDGESARAETAARWRRGPDGTSTRLARVMPAVAWDDALGIAIAFGGSEQGIPSDDTWRWDGFTWARVPLTVRPPAREGAALTYDRRRGVMVLYGGFGVTGAPLDDTWELDGTWKKRDVTGPPARGYTQAVYDPLRDEVLLFGGCSPRCGYTLDASTLLDDTWVYDGVSWTERLVSGPPPRGRAGLAFDPLDGTVVVFGGVMEASTYAPWRWDGGEWSEVTLTGTPPLGSNPTVYEHRLAFDPRRERMVALAMNSVQDFEIALSAIGEAAWEPLPGQSNGLSSRLGSALFFDPARAELVIAGGSSGQTQTLSFGSSSWSDVTAALGVRARQAGAFDPSTGTVVLASGSVIGVRKADTWQFDGERFRQVSASGLPLLDDHSGFTLGGFAYVFGGLISSVGYTNQLRRFLTGPFSSTWENVTVSGALPDALAEGALAVEESTGDVIHFGGHHDGGSLDETHRLVGTVWSELSLATKPPARHGHAMAYDRNRAAIVLFGGDTDDSRFSVDPLGDTWLFAGGAWSDVTSELAGGPGPRAHHVMATDPVTGAALLFGGVGEDGARDNVLFELTTTGWAPVAVLDAPPPREQAVLVADPVRQHVVLYGGEARDDSFTFDRAAGERPAIALHIDVTALGLAGVSVSEVEVRALAGGSGEHHDVGPLAGAELMLWSVGGWQPIASNGGAVGTPALLESGPLDPRDVLFRDKSVNLALAARATNGPVAAAAVVDHVEVRVRYLR